MPYLRASVAAAVFCILQAVAPVGAQNYPARPITMVVPFPPGGLSDVPMRILAPDLQAELGVPIVIENKPGGSGVVGATYVLRAEPDGYTILVNSISDVQNLHYLPVSYSAIDDFTPIGMVADGPPVVLVVSAAASYRTLSDIIEASKKNPKEVSFATSGPATSPAIAINQLNALSGANIVQVPYRGTAPAAAAVLSGEIQGAFLYYATAKQLHDTGKARAIAIAGTTRFPGWPELPTMAELGYPDIVHKGFVGLSAPSKTPSQVISILNNALNTVIQTSGFRQRMEPLGMSVPSQNTPENLSVYMRAETAKQGELAKKFGKSTP